MKTQITNARVLSEKMGLKGCIKWTVFHHNEAGLKKLKELKALLAEGKITVKERCERRQAILENPLYSEIKQKKLTLLDKMRGKSPLMAGVNYNIVTDEGDALIADLMQVTPERVKLDGTAIIGVGTGFVSETKSVDALVTQTGSDETIDATYPKTKGDWAASEDNVVQYRAVFEAGDLNDTGIDEAILQSTTPDTMAYAEITPTVDVSTVDTLQVDWELTYLGS